jgi:hypothetical protein
MSRGALLIAPSRSDGRVARPLLSGTAAQRPLAYLPSDPDPWRWRGNPLQGTRGGAYHPTGLPAPRWCHTIKRGGHTRQAITRTMRERNTKGQRCSFGRQPSLAPPTRRKLMVSRSIRYFRVRRQLLLRGKSACPLVAAERGHALFFVGMARRTRVTALASYPGLAGTRRRGILTVLSRGTRAGGERKTCHTALCTGRTAALRSRRPIGTSP